MSTTRSTRSAVGEPADHARGDERAAHGEEARARDEALRARRPGRGARASARGARPQRAARLHDVGDASGRPGHDERREHERRGRCVASACRVEPRGGRAGVRAARAIAARRSRRGPRGERAHRRRNDGDRRDERDGLRGVRARAAVSLVAGLAKPPGGRIFGLVAHALPERERTARRAARAPPRPSPPRRASGRSPRFANRRFAFVHASRTSGRSALAITTIWGRSASSGSNFASSALMASKSAERLAALARVERDEVQERARPLDVLEKADAEPCARAPRPG